MKKIFKLLLPLLVLLLIYPNIGSANFNPGDELSDLIRIETQVDQGSDVITIARRGGGGGSRSFRSSPSRSGGSSWGRSKSTTKSSPKKSTGWGNKSKRSISGNRNKTKKETVTKKKTTTKKPKKTKKAEVKKQKTKRKLSRADKKLAAKAKKEGKYHKDRKSARADFKKKHAAKYTSKYKTKPATRPTHIPQTTMVAGVSYNVSYNPGFGGYGYYGPSGAWMMYDMMTDIAMMDMMMRRTGYVVATDIGTPVAVRTVGAHYLLNFIYFMIFCLVLVAIIAAIRKGSGSSGDV